jgi:glycosyltransferase involved in cell wall biosynthesis
MKPKVALFYDWLNQWGGAEKVLLDLIKIYPDAPVFTLVYDPKKTDWLPKNTKVIPSFINKLPFSNKNPIFYTPLYPLALEQFNFSQYDVVISTTTTVGHCLITPTDTLFVCYFHNVNRYIYQTPKRFALLKPLLKLYEDEDKIYSQRPDYIFCNSQTVKNRITNHYCREAQIINPGVDTEYFRPSKSKQDDKYFLTVSRLVPHKKIDLAIFACHKLNLKLLIVGDGRQKQKLNSLIKRLNDPNIKLLGKVSDKKLLKLYKNCEALICPQEEDYGLTPLEAQACGKPVIAFNRGGIVETVISGKTGILFSKQSVNCLKSALKLFSKSKFNPSDCVYNANKFSKNQFMLNFKEAITALWKKYQGITIS